MKKLAFIVAVSVACTISACSSNNQDSVNNAEVNQPAAEDLNQLSTDAANTADSEAAALGNQQAQLNSENAAADDNTSNPTDEQEQNVSGM